MNNGGFRASLGWLSCKSVVGTLSIEEVTHLKMLSDEGLWHEVNRMCWNRQLGYRCLYQVPPSSQVEKTGQRGYGGKVLAAKFCWPLLLLGERRFWSIFRWIVTCYGLCFEEIYWRGHGQGYMDSPEEGFAEIFASDLLLRLESREVEKQSEGQRQQN